jgi:hypothetical protein
MTDNDRAAVERLAHEIWVRRGRQPGRALEDWLEAERQWKAKHAAEVAAKTHAGSPAPRSASGPAAPSAAFSAPRPTASSTPAGGAAAGAAPLAAAPRSAAPVPPRAPGNGSKKNGKRKR